MTEIVFHLPASVLADQTTLKPYYAKLIDGLAARGHAVRLLPHDRATLADRVAADEDFHIVDHGNFRHPRVLNTGIAYIYPFWNLDPWGIRALSSIAQAPFDPVSIDAGAARAFANRLRKRWVAPRKSRYEQPMQPMVVPADAVAVFLQSEDHRSLAETCYLDLRQMVKALLARDDPRPIVIKPHPLDQNPATRRFLNRVAARDPRVRVLEANIHDILARAVVCVTINSAVGVEAMLHGVPVVLCGQSDFHHAAVTVKHPDAFDAAVAQAEAQVWAHDAFVYWYFGLNCLNAGRDSLVDDFLLKLAAARAGAD